MNPRSLTVISLFAFFFASCGNVPPSPLPPGTGTLPEPTPNIRIALNWFPEVEHGGYYEAVRRGFYAEEGLNVEILPGGPGAAVVQRVASSDVSFGVENADKVIFGRAAGADVVAVFAPIQISPHCIMVHDEAGFSSLRDLRDVTLALSPNAAFGTFLRATLPLANVSIIPYSGSVAAFLADKRFAQQGYLFSEPLLAAQAGARPRAFLVADLGFNPYTSLLITQSVIARDRSALLEKMVRASRRGWESYCDSPAETNRMIHGINATLAIEILDRGASLMKPMVRTETTARDSLGSMEAARWTVLVNQMTAIGLVETGAVITEEAWTSRFTGR